MQTLGNDSDPAYLAAVLKVLGDESLSPRDRLRVACSYYWRALALRDTWTESQRRLAEDIRPLLRPVEKGVSYVPEAHVRPLISTLRLFASTLGNPVALAGRGAT
jgi:hypothetical protein